jgi:hypothetical protein
MTTDIARLFATDPLKHTTEDIDAMIERFRSARHLFNSGNATAARPKTLTAGEKKVSQLGLTLDIKL